MKRFLAVLMVAVMLLALVACGQKAPAADPAQPAADSAQPAEGEKTIKILFTQTHNDNSFMAYLAETLVATAAEYGAECVHLTCGSDESVQLAQIEQAVSSGEYDAIIADCAGDAVIQGFKQAREAGIPCITMHEGVSENPYLNATVACSLAQTGYTAICLEREQLGEGFNLAIFNGSEGHGATVAIREGYDKALAEYPDINVVFDGHGNWNAADAMALAETWFASGTKIDGIVAMNDGMATGIREVMKSYGVLGQIPIYSNDCEADTLKAVENGEQSGSFDMNAQAQCTAAVETVLKLIKGETLEETNILVDPLLVTKDNLEEYRAAHAESGSY